MKELISIYVSLFLVFSPLLGQTKQEANMHMTNGDVVKVTIINVSKEFIKVEMINKDGKIIKPNIPKNMIYQILSPDGKSLYTNPDAEYKKTFQEFKVKQKQSEQLMRSSEYEKKEKWNIRLVGGDSYPNVALWGLREDSLVAIDMESTKTIYIGSIVNISATKEKSKAGRYAKKGFITGAFIGITLVGLLYVACIGETGEICGDGISLDIAILVGGYFAVIIGAPFALIGAGIGSSFRYVEEYDMWDWSIEEKKAQIQEIMKK